MFYFFKTLMTSAAVALFSAGAIQALPISNTDLWDASSGALVTNDSGVCCGASINSLFDGAGNPTLFRDFEPAGTVHSVEWQTTSAVTVRSFILNAGHDGDPRDANARGFSEFRLFAFDTTTSAFEQIFSYMPGNTYDQSVAPANGIVEPFINGATFPSYLSLGVNIDEVTASLFRAEFVQFGTFGGNANGPRVFELDGFETRLNISTVPLPASFGLVLAGIAGLAGLRHRRRKA